eukprot:PhF_6_TR8781/c0_g1_i3/m.13913
MPLIILSCESEEGIVMTDSYEGLLQAATDAYGSTITPGMQLILTYTYMGHTVTIRSQQHFDAFVRMSNLSEPLRCVVQQRKPLKISTVTDEGPTATSPDVSESVVRARGSSSQSSGGNEKVDFLDARELRSTFQTLGSMTPKFNDKAKATPLPTTPSNTSNPTTPKHLQPVEPDEMLIRVRRRLQELELGGDI